MSTRADDRLASPAARWALWFGMLGGPVAWSLHLLISVPLVPVACALGSDLILHLVTLITALGAAAAAAVAGWQYRQIRRGGRPAGPAGQDRFMALYGLGSSLFFLFVTLIEGAPVLLLNTCPA